VLGHEVVGAIRSAGPGVGGVEPGTPVAVHPATPCGRCAPCRSGTPNICTDTRYLGSAARYPHVPGGFTDLLVVPAGQVSTLPGGLDLRLAALAEPAAVAWHAVRRAGDVRGARVLVTGAGPIGCLVVAAARAAGAAEVVATDLYEQPLAVARAVGATATVPADALDVRDVDVAVEASGSAAGLDTCLSRVRPGGQVVTLGMQAPGPSPAAVNTIISRELRVSGSFRFGGELSEVVAALASGVLPVDPVVTTVRPADAAVEAFALAADPTRSCKVLLDFAPS